MSFSIGLVHALNLHESTDLQAVGTLVYMAPEQAASRPIGSAADWFSVGVMLFQALTGRLPFTGAPHEILAEKQVRQVQVEGTDRLSSLCNQLLRLRPEERPDGMEVLRLLGEEPPSRQQAAFETLQPVPFVGRVDEICQLRAALEKNWQAAVKDAPKGDSLGWMDVETYLALARQSLQIEVCEPLAARGLLDSTERSSA